MSEDLRTNVSSNSIEETRQKKMEEFKRTFDPNAIRGDYDESPAGRAEYYSSDASSVTSYSTDSTALKRKKKNNEINSFSDSDTKKRIERDSKKELKQQKKEEKKIEKLKARRNRRIFKLVWISMVVIIGVMIAQFVMTGVNDLLAINRQDNARTVKVSIPEHASLDSIADILYDSGVIRSPMFFKMYAKRTSDVDDFLDGDFYISTDKDYEAIINILQSNTLKDIRTVQITEGMNLREIAQTLCDNDIIEDDEFDAFLEACNTDQFDEMYPFLKNIRNTSQRYYKLEGYLFPDTYDFYVGEEFESIIDKFLSNFRNKFSVHKERYYGDADKLSLEEELSGTGYSIDEILTIASIIQAEAANKTDMYNISSVLHNRLDYGASSGVASLNCDCTMFYPYRDEAAAPAGFASRYNTNNIVGLPPGPICNPGVEAIKAAIRPYETNYLFFCHKTARFGNKPMYAETLEEHEENLANIDKPSSDEEDSGYYSDYDYDYYYDYDYDYYGAGDDSDSDSDGADDGGDGGDDGGADEDLEW